MDGLLKEVRSIISETEEGSLTRDAALIIAAVRSSDFGPHAFDDHRQRQHPRSADAAEEERMVEQGGVRNACHQQSLLREWRFVKRMLNLSA